MKTATIAAIVLPILFLSYLALDQALGEKGAVSSTIVVPNDFPSIQEAIENAAEGDTIFVKRGAYEEITITIDKPIRLTGENVSNTLISLHPPWIPTGGYHLGNGTIEPDYGYDSPIKIKANNVEFAGFTVISNASSSISILGNDTLVIGNYITTGLYVANSGQNISRNIINGTVTIIGNNKTISNNVVNHIWILANYVLVERNFVANDYGIAIGGAGNIVVNNTIRDSKVALHFWARAQGNMVYHNNFINNTKLMATWLLDNLTVAKWDNGDISGGNYWDDYRTRYPYADEVNASGIGNIPYAIDGYNQDNYPLIYPINMSNGLPNLIPASSPTHAGSAKPSITPSQSESPPTTPTTPFSSNQPTQASSQETSPTPSIPEFPHVTIFVLAVVAFSTSIFVSKASRRDRNKRLGGH
jgi:hypothetical protein